MAYRDLREFIAALGAQGELVRVSEPVSTVLEMTEICTRLLAQGGPAVLFERPIRADGEVFALARGDAVTFGATVPHTWRNPSRGAEARVVWVIAPALPDPRRQADVP